MLRRACIAKCNIRPYGWFTFALYQHIISCKYSENDLHNLMARGGWSCADAMHSDGSHKLYGAVRLVSIKIVGTQKTTPSGCA